MSLSQNENLLLEAFKSMLSTGDGLGLKAHDADHAESGRAERGFEHLHGQIDEMFAVKAAELTHHTGVCAAFSKVHGYKYIDDPTFREAMVKEMLSQGIPSKERELAAGYVKSIVEELSEESESWSEADFGMIDLKGVEDACFPWSNE